MIEVNLWLLLSSPLLHFTVGCALVVGASIRTKVPLREIASPDRRKIILAAIPQPIIWLASMALSDGGLANLAEALLTFLFLILAGIALYYPLASLTIWTWDRHNKGPV